MPTNIELPKKDGIDTTESPKTERLINNITFFGDSAIPEGDPIYNDAFETAKLLAQNGYLIANGGGPGIMKAATSGAESVNGETTAIYWEPKLASHFEGKNLLNETDESSAYSNYMMRTLGLIEKGDVYVVFKGGTGTISELGMVWCLAKLYYGCHKPVILFGDFWDELIESVQKTMYIDEVEMSVLHKASSPEEVLNLVKSFEQKFAHCKRRTGDSDESPFIISAKHLDVTKNTYNQIASSYHDTHVGKLVSQKQLDEFMSLIHAPAKILDIGCGPGYDLKYLSSKFSVKGIDISDKFVKIAQFENPDAVIELADIVKYPLERNSYKGIWARDSIHHIAENDLDSVFKKISDALVEGGVFYVIVREGIGEIFEKEKKNYSTLERFYHQFSVEELTERAKRAGLNVVKIDHEQRAHKWLIGVFQK